VCVEVGGFERFMVGRGRRTVRMNGVDGVNGTGGKVPYAYATRLAN
jgi:hypothetical protein